MLWLCSPALVAAAATDRLPSRKNCAATSCVHMIHLALCKCAAWLCRHIKAQSTAVVVSITSCSKGPIIIFPVFNVIILTATLQAQGFGNVGAWAAEIFHEQGGKVLAASDAFGATKNENGLDIPALRKHLGTGAKLADFPGGDQFRALAMLKLYAVHNPVDHWHDSAVLPAQHKT